MNLLRLFLLNVFLFFALLASSQGVIYVDADAKGDGSGSSWQNAYVDLSEAVNTATSGDEIWVAAGIYVPTQQPNYDIGSSNPRFNHFTLKNGVTLLGGFAGDETDAAQRDLEANLTVLSADIDHNDNTEAGGYVADHTQVVGNNALKLFYFPRGTNVDTTAVLDGFILSGGVADNDVFPYMGGAAMLCQGASPKVVNCHFSGHYAKVDGGAIWIENSSMIIENCTFSGNFAEVHAGAVNFKNTSAALKNCTFSDNTAKYGGAVYIEKGADISVIENCAFEANNTLTGGNGGGISISNARVFMANTSFIGNSADQWGGGVVLHEECDVDVINCIINSNEAGTDGGGIGTWGKCNIRITNSIVRGNQASSGAGILNGNGTMHLYNVLVSGNKCYETGTYPGSAVVSANGATTGLTNVTVTDNGSNVPALCVIGGESKMNIYNSIIWHNGADFHYDDVSMISMQSSRCADAPFDGINGNIGDKPLFLYSPGDSGAPHTKGDYNLWGNSPVNNKASNTYLPEDVYDLDNDGNTWEPIPYDLDGKERVFAGVVDMGCYEQQFASVSGNKLSLYDNQHVDMGDNLTLNNTDFTIETWVYPRPDAANDAYHNICGNNSAGTSNRPPSLYIFQYDRIHYGYGDGTKWVSGDTEKALKTDQWNHIAMTFNDATNTLKIYANGKLLEEFNGTGEVCSTPLKYLNSDQELRAYLDEFRVWKKERTQEELITTMNSTLSGNEEGLALYYSFDQVNSGEIEDQAGINNGAMINTPGVFNSDAITTPVLKPVSNVGIDNFTISWNPVPDAMEYYIDVATDPEFKNLVRFGEPTNRETTYTVNGLSRGTVYYYKVTARTNNDDWGRQYAHTATKLTSPGNAFKFDGNTYIDATDVTKYEFEGTTIETWIKKDMTNTNRSAIWACNTGDGDNNYLLFLEGDNHFTLSSKDAYDSFYDMHFNNEGVVTEGWHHVAVTLSKDGLARLYVDGVEVPSGPETIYVSPFPYTSVFSIGQEFDGTDASDLFLGEMDEFRIWNRVLSGSEIQERKNVTLSGNEDGLVTYYNFDLQTGNKVVDNANIFDGDVVGTSNWVASTMNSQDFTAEASNQTTDGFTINWENTGDYTIDVATDAQFSNQVISGDAVNGNYYAATGLESGTKYYFRVHHKGQTSKVNYTSTLMPVPGNALLLDGKDDFLQANQLAELNFGNDATVECWVKVDLTESRGAIMAINSASGGNQYLLIYEDGEGYNLFDGKSGKAINSYDERKGAWVHLAVTMNSSDEMAFYLDGELIGTKSGGNTPFVNDDQVSFGQEYDGTNESDFLKGAIDEVRIWNYERSGAEIRSAMHRKLNGDEEGLEAYYDFDQTEGLFAYEKVKGLDATIDGNPEWVVSDAIITPLISGFEEVTPASATLSWYRVNNAVDYKIEVATDAGFQNVVQSNTIAAATELYEIEGLTEGTDYFVRMASNSNNRRSDWSLTEEVSTLLVPPGNAYHFDGTNYISMDEVTNEDYTNGATVELWVKPQAKNGDFEFPTRSMIWANNTPTGGNHYIMNYNSVDKLLHLWGANQTIEVDLNDSWNHIAVVLNNNTPSYVYVNGREMASFTMAKEPLLSNSRFSIGQEWDNDTPSDFYSGAIDEVRIWNKALTQEEIKATYHTAVPGDAPGLISYFNFDETEGKFVYDANGTYSGEVIGNTSRVDSKALITPFTTGATGVTSGSFTATWEAIPGAANYYLKVATDSLLTKTVEGWENVEVGDVTSYEVTGLKEHTNYYYGVMSETDRFSAWSPGSDLVKTSGTGMGELAVTIPDGNENHIDLSAQIAKIAGKSSGAITGWFKTSLNRNLISMYGIGDAFVGVRNGWESSPNPDESFSFFVRDQSGAPILAMDVLKGRDYYTDDSWHHFAVITGDGNNRILIDGREQKVYFRAGNKQTQVFTNVAVDQTSELFLGRWFEGSLDEFAFYKNPITNSEARERAHKKLTGNEIGLVAYYNFDNSTPVDASGFGRDGVEGGEVSYERANLLPVPFANEPLPGVTVTNLSWNKISGAAEYQIDVATDKIFKNKIVSNRSVANNAVQIDHLDKNQKYFYRLRARVDGEWSEYSGRDEFFALPGKTLVLDGEDDYVRVDGISDYPSDEATIECWVKADPRSGFDAIWAHNENTTGVNQYVLLYDAGSEKLRIATMDPDGTYGSIGDFTGVDLYSSWHHLAVSIIKDGNSVIYVDGKKVGEFIHHLAPIINDYQFSIGQEWDHSPTATASDFFKGEIDEFRVWNIALTEAEIRANMNVSEPEGASEHYVAHYTFDEIHEGNIFKDLAKQNDGIMVNGPVNEPSNGVINPITLEPSDITPGSFTMHLNDIASAQSYEVEIATDETFVPPLALHENIGKTTSFNATDLCPGVKYYYRARAIYDENTISDWSAVDTVSTVDEDAVITNFTATEGDYSGQLKLAWEVDNAYLVSTFSIRRREVGSDSAFALVEEMENKGRYFYTDSTALPGTYYEYSIQGMSYCYDNDTEVVTSNVGFRLPTLEASKDDGRIRLDWEYASDFSQNLEIVRRNAETGIEQIFQEVADSVKYFDTTMNMCVPYEYKLVAKTADFGDVTTRPVIYTLEEDIFEAIDTLDASKGYSDGKITLNWESHKQSIIDEYQISRRRYDQGAAFQVVKIIDKGTTQVWIDEDASPGEYYEYCIIGIGNCGDNTLYTDSVFSAGFRQPEGILNGQVNYEGGNPVPDVRVVVNYEGKDKNYGSALQFDGNDSILLKPVYDDFSFANGMTMEMWLMPDDVNAASTLFHNSGVSLETDGAGNLIVHSGSASVQYDAGTDASDVWNSGWNHVAFTANDSTIRLLINGQKVAEVSASTNLVLDSINSLGAGYAGLMDEFRLWNTARTDSVILRDHSLVLPRQQEGLIAAWRFDENLGSYAFDHTRIEDEPNKNHGRIYGAEWTKNTASTLKLALGAITEPNGNYQVNGIWFKGSGETFSVTPMRGVHEFDPATRSILISENSLVHNNQDFTDISAFKVTGSVYYDNTDFPVEGVNILLDGNMLMNQENMPVTTDANGQFEVEVPIGEHFLSVSKYGHVFSQGYFPPKVNDSIQYLNFQEEVFGIEFLDSTKYKLAGRIVGGAVEGDKPIGFGKSVNNLGQYTVTLTPQKEGVFLDKSGGRDTTFTTDAATGEYEIELLPEVYIATDVVPSEGASHYPLESGNVLDMCDVYTDQAEKDTLYMVNEAGQEVIDTIQVYNYNKRFDWIYRSTPEIGVSSADGAPVISDLVYQDVDDEDTTNIELVVEEQDGSVSHAFDHPVFHYGGEYHVLIELFEAYENYQTGESFSVPVKDGEIRINNEMSTVSGEEVVELTDSGKVIYTFYGGFPNLTTHSDPSLSFTKKMEIKAFPEGGLPVSWDPKTDDGVYRAYLLGAKATGNNFVTTGPNEVKFILRDPPGSNSYSYYEEGFTTSSTSSYSLGGSFGHSRSAEVSFSPTLTFSVGGFGFETQTEIQTENSLGVSAGMELSKSSGNSWTQTTTYQSSYQTSDDPAYTGAEGDVFFGNSTNIVYGLSNFLEIMPQEKAQQSGPNVSNGYVVGTRKGLRINPEFGTMFIYTQNHIENYLIPNLKMLRDLQFANNPDKYVSYVAESNPNYGTSNDDPVWGSLAASGDDTYDGPSYKFNALPHDHPNWHPDSVRFFNQQIEQWENLLARNEREKVEAESMINNISFDAGSIYESSITTSKESTKTSSFEFTINASVAETHGMTVNDVGAKVTMETSVSSNQSWEDETSTTKEKTVGFVLADGDQGDYFTVDVKQCKGGNGPVFMTRGGQSSCPYEGEDLSKYYQPGQHIINNATMRIEVPQISAENNTVINVPEDLPASYKLNIANVSETGDDNWFMVKVDAASNPDGAKVKMDGGSINGGIAILVPSGQTLTKTLEISKGSADVNDYEGINIIMHSLCQFDPTDDLEDIADTVTLNAHFIPTCTEVAITEPGSNWLVNADDNDKLEITMSGYNLQHGSFEKFDLQYKPASGSQWITQAVFFNDTTNFAAYNGEKHKIEGKSHVIYSWDMKNLSDRAYDLRVRSICSDGSEYASEPISGILDGIRPQLFGAPSPADGILEPNDEIMISFNEPIEEGLVSPVNIDVEGVLNGSAISHGASLSFDGNGDYVTTPAGINLGDRSFTLEFWAKKDAGATGTVLSQGDNARENLNIRFSETHLEVIINGATYAAEDNIRDGNWHHWAVVYDNDQEILNVFADDTNPLTADASATSAEGVFTFGKSLSDEVDYFTGALHDVRIWKRARSAEEVVSEMNRILTGNETGLFANWPMDEGTGEVLEEVVHSRHATHNAEWLVVPSSKAYALNGTDQSLRIDMSAIPLTSEMDLTLEMWFKTPEQAQEAYLFSNGDPAVDLFDPAKTLGVKMNASGQLVVESKGNTLSTPASYTDDKWHHFALVVNRRGYATIYMDGENVASITAPGFGSVESPFAYLGAKGYVDNSGVQHITHRLSGVVDEVRIWNTARKQEQIQLYRNNRLAGTEAGLKAYFPFEKYEEVGGVLMSAFTLDDQSVDPYSATGANHVGALSVSGTESASDVSPNIKRQRPKQAVNFDYVVNSDQIIITPTDPLSVIEDCILEITVKYVQDKHGNQMASPATWTAFIDKNQLRWKDDYFEYEKEMNESLVFETMIENTSGVPQSFNVSNVPSWLTVDPVNGMVSPDDEMKVTFTVANGMNIGDYTEDIFLAGASGYNERLTLDMSVFKQAPHWKVNESQYDASMNIIGQVSVQNIFSDDPNDMLGVFAGDECRGVAHLEYKENYDAYFVFLVVYGNEAGERLTYKFWDASDGKIFTDVSPVFDFEPDALHGDAASPVVFEIGTNESASIELDGGWKWLSFNLNMENPAVDEILNYVDASDGDVVKHSGEFAAYDANSGSWIGSLNQFEIGKLYRINTSKPSALTYQGAVVSPSEYPVTLSYGWNRIGFIPDQNMTVSEALAGFEPQVNDVIKGQYRFAIFDGYDWIGSLEYMEPGRGYMYHSSNAEDVQFVYPEVSAESGNLKVAEMAQRIDNIQLKNRYEYSLSMVIRLDADLEKAAEVQAFIGDEFVGEAAVIQNGALSRYGFLTVFGNEEHLEKNIRFVLKYKGKQVDLNETSAFIGNDITGSLFAPVELSLTQIPGLDGFLNGEGPIEVYPNPFDEALFVSFYLPSQEEVSIRMRNVYGQHIFDVPERLYNAGFNEVEIGNLTGDLKPGVYFVELKSDSLDKLVKIIKK